MRFFSYTMIVCTAEQKKISHESNLCISLLLLLRIFFSFLFTISAATTKKKIIFVVVVVVVAIHIHIVFAARHYWHTQALSRSHTQKVQMESLPNLLAISLHIHASIQAGIWFDYMLFPFCAFFFLFLCHTLILFAGLSFFLSVFFICRICSHQAFYSSSSLLLLLLLLFVCKCEIYVKFSKTHLYIYRVHTQYVRVLFFSFIRAQRFSFAQKTRDNTKWFLFIFFSLLVVLWHSL